MWTMPSQDFSGTASKEPRKPQSRERPITVAYLPASSQPRSLRTLFNPLARPLQPIGAA